MAKAKKAAEAENTAAETVENAATAAHETEAKAETKGAAAETSKQYIYVGASLPGINENTTITGKIPAKLEVPFVRELVIPIERFTEFLKNKAVTESREAYCYRKSIEYAKSLKK